MIVGLLIVMLFPAVILTRKDLKFVCGAALVITTASAIIGLMQYYGILGMDQATLVLDYFANSEGKRVPGMAESQLELAYVLSTVSLVILAMWLTKGVTSSHRTFLFFSLISIVAALYFTYMRSALLAVGFGLVAMVLFLKTKVSGSLILGIVIVTIILIESTGALNKITISGRSETNQQESSLSRPILWQAGIAIALDHPFLELVETCSGKKLPTMPDLSIQLF